MFKLRQLVLFLCKHNYWRFPPDKADVFESIRVWKGYFPAVTHKQMEQDLGDTPLSFLNPLAVDN